MSEPTPPTVSSTLEYYRPVPEWAPRPPKPRYWLHVLLLLATCFTTLVMGARMQYNFDNNRPALSFSDEPIAGEVIPFFPASWAYSHPARLLGGLPFMATLMLFFLAHEMGHYLYCRRYGVYATLPFFIPMLTPIGTMGAVILIRSRIRSRTALFDIGIAGPIAGFVVAVAVLVVSLGWSKPMRPGLGAAEYELGYPLIFQLAHHLLAQLGQEMGFEVKVYSEEKLRGEPVSSSHIRKLIGEGRVSRARHLLARPFSILGNPGRGRGLGSKYTVPTINLARYEELVPKDGVYITWTRVADERFDSVTNVGNRPTFGADSFAIETHLLNFHPIELTPESEVEICFLNRLRDEIKFPSVEALREQISRDVKKARRYFQLLLSR